MNKSQKVQIFCPTPFACCPTEQLDPLEPHGYYVRQRLEATNELSDVVGWACTRTDVCFGLKAAFEYAGEPCVYTVGRWDCVGVRAAWRS